MAAQPKWVNAEIDGAIARWRIGDVLFEVDGARGARIITFGVGSENLLIGPDVNALNYGSTFWPSPQAEWGWPPPVEIDSEPYEMSAIGSGVSFVGRPSPTLGLSVKKTFWVDGDRELVLIEYTMRNHGKEPRSVAPWEISRHPTGGLIFFPAGGGIDRSSTLAAREAEGAIWLAYDASLITDHQKLLAHGSEGWVGYLHVDRGLLLLKTFPEIARTDQAPGEAEIELYADPNHTYVEVEEQGAYRPLAPDQEVSWAVTWRLRRLPPALVTQVGNKDLLALARYLTGR